MDDDIDDVELWNSCAFEMIKVAGCILLLFLMCSGCLTSCISTLY